MKRTTLSLVIGCCALAAAAITAILESDDLFSAAPEAGAPVAMSSAALTPNTDRKRDRLPVISLSEQAAEGAARFDFGPNGRFVDPLRQAYASDSPLSPGTMSNAPVAIPQAGALKPRPAKTPPQKNYSLLSDAQIAAIKTRLKLTPSQEIHWPAVETSLRKIAKTMHERRLASASPPIDPESAELSELQAVAMPLVMQLREDQKREIRALARLIGLEAVASQL